MQKVVGSSPIIRFLRKPRLGAFLLPAWRHASPMSPESSDLGGIRDLVDDVTHMPVWASILIAALSGLSGGLIGTLIKVSEDRKTEVRRATIDAMEGFAALATEWFAVVGEAIQEAERTHSTEDSEARRIARDSLKEGRKRLDRLAILLGPRSTVVGTGARVLHLLDGAVEELPDGWPEATLVEDDHDHIARLATEEDRFDYVADLEGELLDEAILESKQMHALALEGWPSFAEAAALHLHRGLLPRPRALSAAYRRGVQWVRFKRIERRYRRQIEKRAAARKAQAAQSNRS
jgi:hypothetical protein